MKQERAQELYSDYAEGTLTPALKLALEQHFEADPAARADYAQFAQVYALLEQPATQEQEVPLGFRAKILERVSQEQAKRDTTFTTRTSNVFTTWLSAVPHRRTTGGALAALAVVVLMGFFFFHPPKGHNLEGGQGPGIAPPSIVMPEMLQKVDTEVQADNNNYHQFHLHLPGNVSAATVNAYVITDTNQITDPAHLSEATPALTNQHLTQQQGVAIPIAAAQATPAGSTLNLLVQWTPDDPKQTPGAEAIFTPFGAADPTTPAPVNANFLDAIKAVAAHYGATVALEADTVPTQTVTADFSTSDASGPLAALAKTANYAVQALPNNTYYVYDPTQAH